MQFNVDYKYKNRVEELTEKYNKLTPLFDTSCVTTVFFELGNREILILRNTGVCDERSIYRYRQIKKLISYTDGLLVIFKDKNFVFLPVTDFEDADDGLVLIAKTLFEKMKFKFSVRGRLYVINYDSENQKRKHLNLTSAHSPVICIIGTVVAVLIAILFSVMPNVYEPVSREECTAVTSNFETFDKDSDDTIYLYFEGEDEEQWIDYSCYSNELYTKISALKKGDKLEMLINPNIDYIVELKHSGEEILNFDISQKAMYEDAKEMGKFGYYIVAVAVVMLVVGIVRIVNEKKQKSKQIGDDVL